MSNSFEANPIMKARHRGVRHFHCHSYELAAAIHERLADASSLHSDGSLFEMRSQLEYIFGKDELKELLAGQTSVLTVEQAALLDYITGFDLVNSDVTYELNCEDEIDYTFWDPTFGWLT